MVSKTVVVIVSAYAILSTMKGSLKRHLPRYRSRLRLTGEGYTITEVLIVLAVTSALFVAVALSMRGRQAAAEFNQAVRSYEAGIQNVISDVENGYYSNNFLCQAGVTGSPTFPAGTPNPGANKGCVFAGKIVEPDTDETKILTLVARQFAPSSTSELASSIEQSDPVVVPATKNVNQLIGHDYGLRVTRMVDLGSPTSQLQAFGYLIRTSGDARTGLTASSSGIELFGVGGSMSANSTEALVEAFPPAAFYRLNEGMLICMTGANGQDAAITLGVNNSPKSLVSVIGPDEGGICP